MLWITERWFEMGTIRKEGFTGVPLLLGAATLTEAGRHCHTRDRPLHALDHGAMVEMGTIRKEGFTGVPLLLGAATLTEAGRHGNPIG